MSETRAEAVGVAEAPARERPPARYIRAKGILLTEDQDGWLREHAARRGVSAASIVRWALDAYRSTTTE